MQPLQSSRSVYLELPPESVSPTHAGNLSRKWLAVGLKLDIVQCTTPTKLASEKLKLPLPDAGKWQPPLSSLQSDAMNIHTCTIGSPS